MNGPGIAWTQSSGEGGKKTTKTKTKQKNSTDNKKYKMERHIVLKCNKKVERVSERNRGGTKFTSTKI